MSDETLEMFKARLRHAVEAINASRRRKSSMHEELISHFYLAYQEELSRNQDERVALPATVCRLGDLHALRNQLQASVPWLERLFSLLRKEPPMSNGPRLIGWVMTLIGGAFMFGLAIVLPAAAKVAQALHATPTSDRALDAEPALKYSLVSLTLFAGVVSVAGIAMLIYTWFRRRPTAEA